MTVATLLAFLLAGQAPPESAVHVNVPGHLYGQPLVQVLESMPPQFELTFTREMPTPGWVLRVDELHKDAEAGRIVARITEIRPEGMVAQVITPAELRLSLGTLAPAHYVLEIHSRRGEDGVYLLVDALVVVATR